MNKESLEILFAKKKNHWNFLSFSALLPKNNIIFKCDVKQIICDVELEAMMKCLFQHELVDQFTSVLLELAVQPIICY